MKSGFYFNDSNKRFSQEFNYELHNFKKSFLSNLDPKLSEHYHKHFLDVLRYQYKEGVLEGLTLIWMIVFDAPNDNYSLLNHMWEKYQDDLNIEDFKIMPKYGSHRGRTALDLIVLNNSSEYRDFFEKVRKKLKNKNIQSNKNIQDTSVMSTNQEPLKSYQPIAGIDAKYLGGALPNLPHASMVNNLPSISYNMNIMFVGINAPSVASLPLPLTKKVLHLNSSYFKADFHSYRSNKINNDDKIIFVCAGRTKEALVPPVSQTRCIVVLTEAEYTSIQPSLSPFVEVLVIKELNSLSHGNYGALHTITSRRIAIFIFAHYYKLKHFMMADDNISQVKVLSNISSKGDADNLYEFMATQLGDAGCISIKTQSPKKSPPGKLGSKLFMVNMQRITQLLPHTPNMFLFFPDAWHATTHWGEDYYMQIMLYEMLHPRIGYRELDSNLICLERSHKNRNSCTKKSVQTEYYQLLHSFRNSLPFEQFRWISNTVFTLNKIIFQNKTRYYEYTKHLESVDLLKRHAIANNVSISTMSSMQPISINNETFIDKFKRNIRDVSLNPQIFRYYQIETIKQIVNISSNTARAVLATGSGKTLTQCQLAAIAHASQTSDHDTIIVTPYIELVKQFYQDMLKFNENTLTHRIPPQSIITISCSTQSCNINALLRNKEILKQKSVMIFCRNSFDALLAANHPLLKRTSLFLLDEYQEYPKTIQKLMTFPLNDAMLLGFTATPPPNDMFRQTLYTYTMMQGIRDGFLSPVITDKLGCNYSEENVKRLISALPQILTHQYHPGFSDNRTLSKTKGIIYLPSIKLCESSLQILRANNIRAFCIHSKNPQYKNELKNFIENETPCVLLAVQMLKIGFDDNSLAWTIIAQNIQENNSGHLIDIKQEIGRLLRWNLYKKCGYVLSFDNICKIISSLFAQQKINFQVANMYLAARHEYRFDTENAFQISPSMDYLPNGQSLLFAYPRQQNGVYAYPRQENAVSPMLYAPTATQKMPPSNRLLYGLA